MRELLSKYALRLMDLADATLVRVAEREAIREVLTVNRRDLVSTVCTDECGPISSRELLRMDPGTLSEQGPRLQ